MRFFVTGRSSNYEQVTKAFDELEKLGHEVTIRWTDLPMIKPYAKNQEKAAEYASQQIQGLIDADAYILFAHKDGNGVFTELGAALALAQKHGAPKIFAFDTEEARAAAMFHFHPLIEWRKSLKEILDEVE